MDKNKKLFEGLLKADGINPAGTSESERMAFGKILDRQLEKKQSTQGKSPFIWRKFAIAAIIVIALVCWIAISYNSRPKHQDLDIQIAAADLPNADELMTLFSLRTAMSNGGIEAVDKQFSKAFKILGPRPNNFSMIDL